MRYEHETGEVVETVSGSPLHRQMVAKAADNESGWSLAKPPAAVPAGDEQTGEGDAPPAPERRRGRGTAHLSLNTAEGTEQP